GEERAAASQRTPERQIEPAHDAPDSQQRHHHGGENRNDTDEKSRCVDRRQQLSGHHNTSLSNQPILTTRRLAGKVEWLLLRELKMMKACDSNARRRLTPRRAPAAARRGRRRT